MSAVAGGTSAEEWALLADRDVDGDGPMPADVELAPPAQKIMREAPEHASAPHYQPIGGGSPSMPQSRDDLYSKCLCFQCSVGEVIGKMCMGETHTCFCCKGQCLFGMSSECPGLNLGCDCYKPAGDIELSVKLLCCKLGFVNCFVDKPYIAFNRKTIY